MTTPPAPLPHADLAQVSVSAAKLRDYVLNPNHSQGGPKARVFAAVLGITRTDWQYLRRQLLTGVRAAPHLRGTTSWGDLYDVASTSPGPPDGYIASGPSGSSAPARTALTGHRLCRPFLAAPDKAH